MTTRTTMRLRTYAKVNLFLRVLGRRADGFHEVETILHTVGMYDEMRLSPATGRVCVAMRMTNGIPGTLPQERDNLMTRAAALLAGSCGGGSGVEVAVEKNIPIGAGLGGGSANAAGALVGLAETWGVDIDRATLRTIALDLGSDVPYCLEGGTMLAMGRGEELMRLSVGAPMWFVVAGPGFPLATRDVYEAWDAVGATGAPSSAAITLALGAGDAGEVAALLHNDLEVAAVALQPGLADAKQALSDAGALGASMTGSGPTMFGVAQNEDHAREIAGRIAGGFAWVRVVPSQATCIERLD